LGQQAGTFSLPLKNGESVQELVKAMTETFEGLSVIGDPISEEDPVVHLLASLPDSHNMLVTALRRTWRFQSLKLLQSGCFTTNGN